MEIKSFKDALVKFLREEDGASGIEYALIAAMVAVAIVVFVPGISDAISDLFTKIQTAMTTAAAD